jgi:hypothetical protein
MPTRKQRRRRSKELRHDYEYVYVDDDGREVEVDPAELEQAKPGRNGKREAKAAPAKAKGRNGKAVREVPAPSWKRVLKRVAFIAPLLFLAFSALNHHQSLVSRLAITAVYTGFFAPFMYLMDRAMYRSYLKRTGQAAPPRSARKR